MKFWTLRVGVNASSGVSPFSLTDSRARCSGYRLQFSLRSYMEAPRVESRLLDQRLTPVRTGTRMRTVLEQMRRDRLLCVAVVEGDRDYLGMATAAKVVGRCLPVAPDSLMPGAGLTWATAELGLMQARLAAMSDESVEQFIDSSVPFARASTALPHLLLLMARRYPYIPVLSDTGSELFGIATFERALELLQGQPG